MQYISMVKQKLTHQAMLMTLALNQPQEKEQLIYLTQKNYYETKLKEIKYRITRQALTELLEEKIITENKEGKLRFKTPLNQTETWDILNKKYLISSSPFSSLLFQPKTYLVHKEIQQAFMESEVTHYTSDNHIPKNKKLEYLEFRLMLMTTGLTLLLGAYNNFKELKKVISFNIVLQNKEKNIEKELLKTFKLTARIYGLIREIYKDYLGISKTLEAKIFNTTYHAGMILHAISIIPELGIEPNKQFIEIYGDMITRTQSSTKQK